MSPRAAWRLETLGFDRVYEYTAGKADWLAMGLPTEGAAASEEKVGQLARKDVPTCSLDEVVGPVAQRVRESSFDTCLVVVGESVIVGRLYASDLDGDPDRSVADAMSEGPSTFRPNVSGKQMLRYMLEHGLETAPVSDSTGRLIGLVLREDLERKLPARAETE